jgi:hypothetical protein
VITRIFSGGLIAQAIAALENACFITKSVHAHATSDGGGYPAKRMIVSEMAGFFDDFNSFFRHQRLYLFIVLFYLFFFIIRKRCARISFYAAVAFAALKIADKLLFRHFIADVYIVNDDHASFFAKLTG